MLPGIINQVALDWSSGNNYYIPTIKRHKDKVYLWIAASGPQLGGPKEPGLLPSTGRLLIPASFPTRFFTKRRTGTI